MVAMMYESTINNIREGSSCNTHIFFLPVWELDTMAYMPAC